MKRMERSDLGITMALGALFLAGLLAWGTVLRRERTDLLNQAQLRLDSVAAQVRDDARCVELFAERSLPGGSEFYLIAPPRSAGPISDTIAQYRVHTAGPDTVLQRSRFPVEVPAAMRIHVRLNFLLPMEVSQSDTGSTGSPGVFADRGLLCAEVAGRRMELVDVARFTRSLRETFTQAGDAGYVALIMDTLSRDTLFRTPTHGPADDAPSVRSSAIVPPDVAPWVVVLHLPGLTAAALRETLPYLWIFLALFGVLVLTLWRSRRAWAQERRLAQMQLDLVSNITHEFNTPLTHISLALDTLRRPDQLAQHAHMMEVIGEENERMQANVKKVMSVSLLDQEALPLELELHDAHELLQATLRSLRPALDREAVAVSCTFEASDPWVLVDATYLTNVFHSLLDNAIRYGRAPRRVNIATRDTSSGLRITIADNGPGIPASEQQLVFNKFFRGTNGREASVKGTGIGLYFARKVVMAHGGTIALNAGPAGGVEVELVLPKPAHG
ncbi:MAG: HAMP domain-containing histidine kinase [Flavobacteriales bacterium]|nr:HAMP domain-containing histidine kinase [Flavobacteriales bacterium]MBK9075318.1 HAMP domain-containing histidine kinase [Flavobacteriales bacterium]